MYQGRPGSAIRLELVRDGDQHLTVELTREIWPPLVADVAYTPDSQALAIAGLRNGATVLTREKNASLNRARRYPFRCMSVAYSPDGRFLAMDAYHKVVIWDLDNDQLHGELPTRFVPVVSDEAGASLAFSQDSKYLAAATGWPFLHRGRKSNLHVCMLIA